MKGYMTKYALTQGIAEVEVRVSTISDKYVYREGRYPTQLIINNTFFTDKQAAENAAKAMAEKKVKSLKRSISKMEALAREPNWVKS